jgi:hypothetical protein
VLRVALVILNATVKTAGTLSVRIGKLIPAQVNAAASVTRSIGKKLAATTAAAASALRARVVVLSAVIRVSGTVLATAARPVALIVFKLGVPAFRWVTGNIKKQWRVP